jgi:hypothetical protein
MVVPNPPNQVSAPAARKSGQPGSGEIIIPTAAVTWMSTTHTKVMCCPAVGRHHGHIHGGISEAGETTEGDGAKGFFIYFSRIADYITLDIASYIIVKVKGT